MTDDACLLALVRESVHGFGARHLGEFALTENTPGHEFARELLEEVAELGWLTALSDSEASPGNANEALLLATLVSELGRFSPAIATKLLAHHLCRFCVEAGAPGVAASLSSQMNTWFGLDAAVGDERLAATLQLDHSRATPSLMGSMRFVMGGDASTHWLSRAQLDEHRECLLLVERATATSSIAVSTLGLRGLGVTEGTFSMVAPEHYRVLSTGQRAVTLVQAAYRFVGPAAFGLMHSLLEQTQRLANDHAQLRRQNGRPLMDIPAVRQLLAHIERALALVRVTQQAYQLETADAELLAHDATKAMTLATDAGLQVLGGAGYIVGQGLERLWRDSRQLSQLLVRRDW